MEYCNFYGIIKLVMIRLNIKQDKWLNKGTDYSKIAYNARRNFFLNQGTPSFTRFKVFKNCRFSFIMML